MMITYTVQISSHNTAQSFAKLGKMVEYLFTNEGVMVSNFVAVT